MQSFDSPACSNNNNLSGKQQRDIQRENENLKEKIREMEKERNKITLTMIILTLFP